MSPAQPEVLPYAMRECLEIKAWLSADMSWEYGFGDTNEFSSRGIR
jgi:hypothetical protein